MTAFSIGGDWIWTGSTTLDGASQTITATTGNISLDANLGAIYIQSDVSDVFITAPMASVAINSTALSVGTDPTVTATLTLGNTSATVNINANILNDTSITSSTYSSPDLVFSGGGAGTVTFNGCALINIGSDPSTSAVQLGNTGCFFALDAGTLNIGHVGTSLTITGDIPADIGGSVAVMWNNVTKQFYHA